MALSSRLLLLGSSDADGRLFSLQIMDPKMDSGCLASADSLDEDYDLNRPLLPTEVLGIIDQLLSHEASHSSLALVRDLSR